MKDISSNKRQSIADQLIELPEFVITYFQPDQKKDGGAYVTATSTAKKIDNFNRNFVFTDGTEIATEEIISMESHIFENIYDE